MTVTINDINDISKEYGDSFYILDSEKFEDNYKELTDAFKSIYPKFNIAYSYKTNYIPTLCKTVDRLGGYAEVVSDMELELALKCGVKPENIIWNGPVKNMERVTDFLEKNGNVNVDTYAELKEIIERYRGEKPASLSIRCNFDIGDGTISRFGIDTESEEFDKSIDLINENAHRVSLIGLQCHLASRKLEYWENRADSMIGLYQRVSDRIGYPLKRLDLGGGIYGHMDERLKSQFETAIPAYKDYALKAATKFSDAFKDEDTPELVLEPGTALAGDSMVYILKVTGIKKVRDKWFLTTNGSQKNISMTGINPPLDVIKTDINGVEINVENADVVGYTCIESDVLYRGLTCNVKVGDYIKISNCGSYSIVMKPPFISACVPIVEKRGNVIKLVKRQETVDDIFDTYVF